MVVLLWIFAALFMIPNLTGTWGETGFEESTFSCTVLNQPEKERGINPLRVIMAIGISLPLIVIGASYSILLKVRVCFLKYIVWSINDGAAGSTKNTMRRFSGRYSVKESQIHWYFQA